MDWEGMALPSEQRLFFESPRKGQPSDHVSVITFATDDVVGMQKYLKEGRSRLIAFESRNTTTLASIHPKRAWKTPESFCSYAILRTTASRSSRPVSPIRSICTRRTCVSSTPASL